MTVWWAYDDHADLGLPGPDSDLTEDLRPKKSDDPEGGTPQGRQTGNEPVIPTPTED